MIHIQGNLFIPESEISFKATRSSGPGGQNVNKLSTRIELFFDIGNSESLTEHQKRKITARLGRRVSKEGVLRIVSQEQRTQSANRQTAVERFQQLLVSALTETKPRKATRVSAAAKRRRIEQKRRRSSLKKARTKPNLPSDD
jgi:ribosome-associated protein